MNSAVAVPSALREHAQLLFTAIGVQRIIVVDDEYAILEVEELLGICTELDPTLAAELAYLDNVDFSADREIWVGIVREEWTKLNNAERRSLLEQARTLRNVASPEPSGQSPAAEEQADTKAATSLDIVLSQLPGCEYITLSLSQWRSQADKFLDDDKTATTVLLFDRDFGREEEGTEQEGVKLIRYAQRKDVRYCGLISRTVPLEGETDAWSEIAADHGLERDKFVVVSKERLTSDPPDFYGFLRMLRFVALSGRYSVVKKMAWSIFEESVTEAKATVDQLSVLDFDRIVFESSRQEGVWEPETLFRVFDILMRRAARSGLYLTSDISEAVAEARRISLIPEKIARALGEERTSAEAQKIQRFESYESDEELNRCHLPIELGDIFEDASNHQRYILLAQPCDLMVRGTGKRSYEDRRHGRTGALVELIVDPGDEDSSEETTEGERAKEKKAREEKTKERMAQGIWVELPFYDADPRRSAFANFAKVHQVQLAVLDLCALRADGIAAINVDTACPDLVIAPWKRRYGRLQRFFEAALSRYRQLEETQLSELKSLALPLASGTVQFQASGNDKTVEYSLKRVMRLRQPRSGALLTALTQFQARAAFKHPFERQIPTQREAIDRQGSDHDKADVPS